MSPTASSEPGAAFGQWRSRFPGRDVNVMYNGEWFHRIGGSGEMVSAETKSVIERARRMYANHLQADLESQHMDRFVAIEPESGDYFLGDTFDEAVKLARAKHPSRLSHTIRIGHRAAFHIGGMQG